MTIIIVPRTPRCLGPHATMSKSPPCLSCPPLETDWPIMCPSETTSPIATPDSPESERDRNRPKRLRVREGQNARLRHDHQQYSRSVSDNRPSWSPNQSPCFGLQYRSLNNNKCVFDLSILVFEMDSFSLKCPRFRNRSRSRAVPTLSERSFTFIPADAFACHHHIETKTTKLRPITRITTTYMALKNNIFLKIDIPSLSNIGGRANVRGRVSLRPTSEDVSPPGQRPRTCLPASEDVSTRPPRVIRQDLRLFF